VAANRRSERVAVITGGASGIGLASARLLADRGWRLVLADVEVPRLEDAVDELGGGDDVLGVVTDVASKPSVDALAEATYEAFGRADLVFLNAGVAAAGPTSEVTHEDWTWLMGVNLWGPIHGVEAFVPRMVESRGGHLMFTASFAGLVPNVGLGPYCVTKYGVVALAEVLHRELRGAGVRVSVLCPMRVATEINNAGRNRPAELGGPWQPLPEEAEGSFGPDGLAGRVLPVHLVAEQVVAAVGSDRLYIVPHEESRDMVRRRFQRIDRAFEA
jgi:NAD(P)-dependent dehydrogenase (short-subunit alcohol dehydrogenase family)